MLRLLALALALSTLPTRARAQDDITIRLETGFRPDPARAVGRTRGTVSLSQRAPSCRGFAGEAPDHVLELSTRFPFLRLFTVSAQELTIAVRSPDGGWRCVTGRGDRAALMEGGWAAGRYEVFVGSVQHNQHLQYELQVTEFRSIGPGEERTPGSSIDVGLDVETEEGRFRGRRIRRGFIPDPIRDGATAGGEVDVRLLGAECRGFVTAAPSHVMTLRTEFDYLRIQLGGAPGQATLVLRTPGGRYLCSAPEEANAFLDQDVWPEGVYRIWVGSRDAEDEPAYRICYTEARLSEAAATCDEGPEGEQEEED